MPGAIRKRRQSVSVNGLLLLNKPSGMTSNRALQTVKRWLNAKKAGHTGSLDPSGYRNAATVFWRGDEGLRLPPER